MTLLDTRISQRAREVAESATLAIDAKAKALKAAGEDVISFGAGEPDFATPRHVVEAAQAACAEERYHHYTPAAGLPELREAIARKTERDSGLTCAADQVLVANGGKQALYSTFQVLLDAGDEVLIPAPYWVSYPEQVRLADGVPIAVPTDVSTGFRTSVEQLDAACTPRTKALIFVSPSNPTGAVYPPEEVAAIGAWAVQRGIWVVTDEIYEHLVYEPAQHASMPVLVPELRDRCVVVNGCAKTWAMTGWRVGWTVAPVDVILAMTRLQSHLSSNVSNVAQAAAVAAVDGPLDDVALMRETYNRRRRIATAALDAIPGVQCFLPEGAFYVFPSIAELLGTEVAGRRVTSPMEFAEVLLDVARVAVVPGEAFGGPTGFRLSYALGDVDLERGLERIAAALAR